MYPPHFCSLYGLLQISVPHITSVLMAQPLKRSVTNKAISHKCIICHYKRFFPFFHAFGSFLCVYVMSFSLTECVLVIFQLQLLTTWGDPYYIGLNGLEFYDQNNQKIPLSDNSILMSTYTCIQWPHTHTHVGLPIITRTF